MSTIFEFDQLVVSTRDRHRPLLTICTHTGCPTLTMGGGTCIEHDVPVKVDFPRGRPFVAARQEERALEALG